MVVAIAGLAGDVYLCHPFLVHAAQSHLGTTPRFLAQLPLYSTEPYQLHGGRRVAHHQFLQHLALDSTTPPHQ